MPETTPPAPMSALPSRSPSLMERAFPTVMRYSGLVLAMYEGFLDRPPQELVCAMAAVMMAGAQVLERIVERKAAP